MEDHPFRHHHHHHHHHHHRRRRRRRRRHRRRHHHHHHHHYHHHDHHHHPITIITVIITITLIHITITITIRVIPIVADLLQGDSTSKQNAKCCSPNPCLNGGQCRPAISQPNEPCFTCDCRPAYTGLTCEALPVARSCQEHRERGLNESGIYLIAENNQGRSIHVSVFCDFDSETAFTWTTVYSYSRRFNKVFAGTHFTESHYDYDFQWSTYRLSFPVMEYIANRSTHIRFTCNFDTEGLVLTDYARAKLSDFPVFETWDKVRCVAFERLNIRGRECENCTAGTFNHQHKMVFIRTGRRDCQFDSGSKLVYQNFGYYVRANPQFRCWKKETSTTQIWFGVQLSD